MQVARPGDPDYAVKGHRQAVRKMMDWDDASEAHKHRMHEIWGRDHIFCGGRSSWTPQPLPIRRRNKPRPPFVRTVT